MWQELLFTTSDEWIMNNQFEHTVISAFPICKQTQVPVSFFLRSGQKKKKETNKQKQG